MENFIFLSNFNNVFYLQTNKLKSLDKKILHCYQIVNHQLLLMKIWYKSIMIYQISGIKYIKIIYTVSYFYIIDIINIKFIVIILYL